MNQIDIIFNTINFIPTNTLIPLRNVCLLWKFAIDAKLLSTNNKSVCSTFFKNHSNLSQFSNTGKIKGNIVKYDLLDNGFLVAISHYYDCFLKCYHYVFNCLDHTGLIFHQILRSTENYEYPIHLDFLLCSNLNVLKIQLQTCFNYSLDDHTHFFDFRNFEFQTQTFPVTFHQKITHRIEFDKWGLSKVSWFESSVLNIFNNYRVHLGSQGYLVIFQGNKGIDFIYKHYETRNEVAYFSGLTQDNREFILTIKSYPNCTFKVKTFYIFQREENISYQPLFFENQKKFYVAKIVKSKKKSTMKFVLLNYKYK